MIETGLKCDTACTHSKKLQNTRNKKWNQEHERNSQDFRKKIDLGKVVEQGFYHNSIDTLP